MTAETPAPTRPACCMCGNPATHHKRTMRAPGLFFCKSCRRDEIHAYGASAAGRFTSLGPVR